MGLVTSFAECFIAQPTAKKGGIYLERTWGKAHKTAFAIDILLGVAFIALALYGPMQSSLWSHLPAGFQQLTLGIGGTYLFLMLVKAGVLCKEKNALHKVIIREKMEHEKKSPVSPKGGISGANSSPILEEVSFGSEINVKEQKNPKEPVILESMAF